MQWKRVAHRLSSNPLKMHTSYYRFTPEWLPTHHRWGKGHKF